MKWRALLILGLVCIFAAGVLSLRSLFHTGDNVTPAAFAHIQVGMTERQVEQILGGPAPYYNDVCFLGPTGCESGVYGEWCSGSAAIWVTFYDGKVCDKRMGVRSNPIDRPASIRGLSWRVQRLVSGG
jgi:hypothetical protein